jgi:Mrp family chromosome partitioning ATPase
MVPPNPTELLSSPAMTELVQDLAKRYDVVVFDTAPVLPVTDAQLLSRYVTAMVVVANTRALRRPQLSAALAALAQVDARVVGLVLNMLPGRRSAEGYGYRAEALVASSRRSAWWFGGRRRAPGPVPGAGAGSAPVLRSRPGLPIEASRSRAPLGAPAGPAARRPGDLVRAADE